jgi:hypothetical protein
MSAKTRLEKLEKESSKCKKTILCIGIRDKDGTVEPKSQIAYEAYLKSGMRTPFVWITFPRHRWSSEDCPPSPSDSPGTPQ